MDLATAITALESHGVTDITTHRCAEEASARIAALYGAAIDTIRSAFARVDPGRHAKLSEQVGAGSGVVLGECKGYYPLLAVPISRKLATKPLGHLAYGYCRNGQGLYTGTFSQPGTFGNYLPEQLTLLQQNHDQPPLLVGRSTEEIPLPFAIEQSVRELDPEIFGAFPELNLERVKDIDGAALAGTFPLSLYSALRTDYAFARLRHYTGTATEHLQQFILLTNYEMFMKVFRAYAENAVGTNGYTELIEPCGGPEVTKRPQMPAMHLKRADRSGISIINIGVGLSNAKTVMDLIATFRPHAVLMVGHCAGLRCSHRIGDFILGEGYYRLDGVMDRLVPPCTPIPFITEINHWLRVAAREALKLDRDELKQVLESGSIATVADRHWEINRDMRDEINEARALAVDMESATVATAGFFHRVPCGTLLRVSDLPTRGDVKLQGGSWQFYTNTVDVHLQIALRAVELMREDCPRLHSRKLRTANDVPFR